MNKALGLVVLLMALASAANAQQIVEENAAPTPLSRADRETADATSGSFSIPNAGNPKGSLVHVTADFHNSDVTVYVANERIDEFKPRVLDLLSRLNLRQAIVHVRRGRRVGTLDIDLGLYMEIQGNRSHAVVPLGTIVDYMKGWDLPQPLGVIIEGDLDNHVRFHGEDIEKVKLLWAKDVSSSDLVETNFERHWYGLAYIVSSVLLSLFVFVIVCSAIYASARQTPVATVAAPTSLVESQARYDEFRKQKRLLWIAVPLFLTLVVNAFAKPWRRDAGSWIHLSPSLVLAILPLALLFLVSPLLVKRLNNRGKEAPADTQSKAKTTTAKYLPYLIPPAAILVGIFVIQATFPKWLYWIPAPVLKSLLWMAALIPILALIFFAVSSRSENQVVLGPGDEDYEAAVELAKKGDVRFRRIIVLKDHQDANAFARFAGTIALTQGSREKLSADERRALIAHELGHIKGRHLPMLLGSTVAAISLLAFAAGFIQHTKLPEFAKIVASSLCEPVILVLLLRVVRSPFQRKAEYSADRFALEQIGSFRGVATPLAKIHLLGQSPHTMTKLHESIASHPSLTKRLNALRDVALQLGWEVPPSEIEDILVNLRLDDV